MHTASRMKHRLCLIPALAALFALGGCVTVSGAFVEGLAPRSPAEPAGVVFVSLGAGDEWPSHAQYRLVGRATSSPDTRFTFLYKKTTPGPAKVLDALFEKRVEIPFEDGPVQGAVLVLRLPPGKYEIEGGNTMISGGPYFTQVLSTRAPFTFKFEVQPGKATYLGEYVPYPYELARFLFFRLPYGGLTYTVRDRLSRDLPLLARAGERFSAEQVVRSVMTPADAKGTDFRVEAGP